MKTWRLAVSERCAVIDASVAVKAVLPNPMRENCVALLVRLADYEILAPALWAYEVTSALTRAVHQGDLTEAEGRRALARVNDLGVHLVTPDENQQRQAFDWTLRLKRAAAYDSFYLALAEGLGCELWTADRRLASAVSEPWLRWVEEA